VPHLKSLKYEERLKVIDIQSLAERRRRGDLIQMYKNHHQINKISFVKPLAPAPALSAESPAKNLRGHDHRLVQERVKNCKHPENFFTNRVVSDWNALPSEEVKAISTNSFKNKLDKYFHLLP
jgi:hypothetical protein